MTRSTPSGPTQLRQLALASLYATLGALATACVAGPELHVQIVSDNDPEIVEIGRQGVEAWGELGFVNDEKGVPLKITRVPNLHSDDKYMNKLNGHADTENRHIQVEARLTGDALLHVVVHELGHVMLGCAVHLGATLETRDRPVMGVMVDGSARMGLWLTMVTQDDLDWACDCTGICVKRDAGADTTL